MHAALSAMAGGQTDCDFEFLFVDDGSTDATFERLNALIAQDSRVKVVRLARNYGSHTGAAAGLSYAAGDAAMIMAGDLQDHPSEIPRFIERWRTGFHVVLGVREKRADSAIDRFLAHCFGVIIRRIALPNYPRAGTGSFCLLDRLVIDALCAFPERNRMTFGLILYSGFRQTYIPYNRLERQAGTSKWTFRSKVKHLFDTVVSFSHVPLRLASVSGVLIALASLAYAGFLVIDHLFHGSVVPGWTTTVVVVLMLGGLQLIVLGIMGEYLWRAHDDIRRRPLYFVQQTAGRFDPARTPEISAPQRPIGGR